MKPILYAATAAALLMPLAASAQFLGNEDMSITQPKMTGQFWAPKPITVTPYVAPNKPHWKLSEILAAHSGQSDWVQPIVRNKDQEADYISMGAGKKTFLADAKALGLGATLQDRLMWSQMRMSLTDIMDVTGANYTFLLNGRPPAANWTAFFNPAEKVRLRLINGSSMTTFDVRIPGMPLTVISADDSDVKPVTVSEFRIGVAETYDVIVQPPKTPPTQFLPKPRTAAVTRGQRLRPAWA